MTTTLDRPDFGKTTVHSPADKRRRTTIVLISVTAALVVVLAAAGAYVALRMAHDDSRRNYLGSDGWPSSGQAAYVIGGEAPRTSEGQRPAPIASMAKVMTAYLVEAAAPLTDGRDGPSVTVTAADVRDTDARRAQDQSIVPVRVGERLTERQSLMALLLPSANNVAAMITRFAAPSEDAFVAQMNATARHLGMMHTHYTDPSGFDDHTVSTAADQLILARVAGADPTLAQMMATSSYRIPVAGTISNTDSLLGHDGFVGMKTGSDDAAGGCFMFHVRRPMGGRMTDVYGVVMGQHGSHALTAGLYAARQLAAHVAPTS